MKNIIKIGTRKSKLALIQTDIVKDKIKKAFPEIEVEIVKIDTKGDQILDKSLTSFGGKGVFTAELEAELLSGAVDIAVHRICRWISQKGLESVQSLTERM